MIRLATAPNAIRIPISERGTATAYAVMPYSPKRQDRNGRHRWRRPERPKCEPHILTQPVDRANAKGVAIFLFDLIETSEFESRPAHRLGPVEPARKVRLHLVVEMKLQFGVDIVLNRSPSEERA